MMRRSWQDCFFCTDGDSVTMGNSVVVIRWKMLGGGLALEALENRATGYVWQHPDGAAVLPACLRFPGDTPVWEAEVSSDPLTAPHWILHCSCRSGAQSLRRSFLLYPACPFLTMAARWTAPDPSLFSDDHHASGPTGLEQDASAQAQTLLTLPGDRMAAIPLPRRHLRWHSVRFADQTDIHDTLVMEQSALVYSRETLDARGNLFAVEDTATGDTLLCARHAPVTPAPGVQFRIEHDILSVLQNGCAGALPESSCGCTCVIGTGTRCSIRQSYRMFYRLGWQAPWQKHALLLSNTWGDRSRDSRVSEAFILQEIRQAAELGLDVVQIDDGWQAGPTVNSSVKTGGVWEGYYAAREDFWTPHPTRFPHGLKPLTEAAARQGIRLGLWFSPDSSHDFANWERDVQTVLSLHRAYGISVFKLDGVNLVSPTARKNYRRFLSEVTRLSGYALVLQQDITAQQRMGYFSDREIGTLFVENRYTDFRNYFPHRTLRNLWMLARWIPAQRLLFELLNVRRNTALYAHDEIAPAGYSMDYLFAVTMLSQPLFWMELSGLSPHQAAELKPVIRTFRAHRDALWACDVQPIGNEPDGFSFPGFLLTDPCNASTGFLLLFREITARDTFPPEVLPTGIRPELLYSDRPVRMECDPSGHLILHFSGPRSFAFLRWDRI